jgi:LysR family nitrogen assimilation transcriptional regulator
VHDHQLRCFLTIAELGSVSQAAAQLHIAQPTLSQMLLRLEDELTIKLFERTARGVSVTEAGRIFQVHARNILNDIDRAKEELHGIENLRQINIAVGLPNSISILLGPSLIVAARRQLPHVRLQLLEATSGKIREWIEQDRTHIGILYDPEAARDLRVRRLAGEDLFMVRPFEASAGGRSAESVTLPGKGELPLVLPGRRHDLRQYLDRMALENGRPLDVEIELDSLVHITSLVASGHAVTILPHSAIADQVRQGRLSAAPITRPPLRRFLYLARNPNQAVTHVSVQVEELVISLMRDMVVNGLWEAQWLGPETSSDESLGP